MLDLRRRNADLELTVGLTNATASASAATAALAVASNHQPPQIPQISHSPHIPHRPSQASQAQAALTDAEARVAEGEVGALTADERDQNDDLLALILSCTEATEDAVYHTAQMEGTAIVKMIAACAETAADTAGRTAGITDGTKAGTTTGITTGITTGEMETIGTFAETSDATMHTVHAAAASLSLHHRRGGSGGGGNGEEKTSSASAYASFDAALHGAVLSPIRMPDTERGNQRREGQGEGASGLRRGGDSVDRSVDSAADESRSSRPVAGDASVCRGSPNRSRGREHEGGGYGGRSNRTAYGGTGAAAAELERSFARSESLSMKVHEALQLAVEI